MGKTSEGYAAGADQDGAGELESKRVRRRSGDKADGTTGERGQGIGQIDTAEHLQQDFARVRAKAATDPALAPRSLSAAWTTDVMEEDEAEFVDAVADCLGAGFSLDSALTGWDQGTLAADGSGPEEGSLFDDEGDRDDDSPSRISFAPRHTPTGGRRFLVT